MQNAPLRLGIAGSGFAGKFHHKNLRGLPAVTVGVTSARASSREASEGAVMATSLASGFPAMD